LQSTQKKKENQGATRSGEANYTLDPTPAVIWLKTSEQGEKERVAAFRADSRELFY
jgi:hypothetical protein